mmetsp:Transcript_12796/g.31232  ORF Transcript_12796/g.31232 Transcript_12796/m.31232 type:complete len:308 (+) Transcript_12796:405-1328(+)
MLSPGVNGPQLGHQFGRILRGVHRQSFGYDQERVRVLLDDHLLPRLYRVRIIVKVHRKRRLCRATPGHKRIALQHPLYDAQGIVQRAIHLVQHVLVRAAQDHGGRAVSLAPIHIQHLPVPDAHLADRIACSQAGRVEGLVPLHVGHGGHDAPPCGLGEAFEILAIAPPCADDARLDEVFHAQVVDALGGEDDPRAGVDDLAYAFLGDVHLALLDVLDLGGVLDDDLNAHPHPVPLEVHVQHGNLDGLAVGGGVHGGGHPLGGPRGVDGESAVDEVGFHGRFAVRLENVNGGERVLVPLFLPRGRSRR